ncbi:hypothetical protein B9Z19DRAFT_1121719 [Tuber borchii]|uniref:Uncharacterized protein n=1 Tax=Tuber borchii TaxID=42251 RepID=A0A2T7A255_TUBBO|nr:hypothetical protein B9Z19DRAFT_1121719 [Tuber borchii]
MYYNGKAYSTTPARATDEEIEDDLAQMRKTWDGKPYVKPALSKEVLPEFDYCGYNGREKAGSSFAKPNEPREPFMKKVVQDSQFKAKEAEPLLDACNAGGEPLAMKEVFQENQLKEKEVESSLASETPTALAPIACAVDAGAPATSRKSKIPEIPDPTNSPLTSSLYGQMRQTENKQGPPHKKLRTTNGAVNRTATQKARYAGGERIKKTARVGIASSVVDKSRAKAAPSVIPAGAKPLPANTEKSAGESAIVSKGLAVVIFTRASSRGIIRKDKSPTAAVRETEDPIHEIVTDKEDKSSTSFESGDDLKKDASYTPVTPRKRRVARKGKAPVASRKRAAPNTAVAPPRRCVRRKAAAPEESITRATTSLGETGTALTKENVKPAVGPREHKEKRVDTPKVRAIVPQQAGPPAAPEVDSTLTAEKSTPTPTTNSVRGEIAVPEEHAPPAAVSETSVGSVEAATPATTSAPPVRVRRLWYRIPAERSRCHLA